jgi:hypothetical protein
MINVYVRDGMFIRDWNFIELSWRKVLDCPWPVLNGNIDQVNLLYLSVPANFLLGEWSFLSAE